MGVYIIYTDMSCQLFFVLILFGAWKSEIKQLIFFETCAAFKAASERKRLQKGKPTFNNFYEVNID